MGENEQEQKVKQALIDKIVYELANFNQVQLVVILEQVGKMRDGKKYEGPSDEK